LQFFIRLTNRTKKKYINTNIEFETRIHSINGTHELTGVTDPISPKSASASRRRMKTKGKKGAQQQVREEKAQAIRPEDKSREKGRKYGASRSFTKQDVSPHLCPVDTDRSPSPSVSEGRSPNTHHK
jgi:hypothetical protein